MIHYRSFFRPVALILIITFLFQSCQIYHKPTRTLEQIVEAKRKVKIITVDNRKMYFAKIEIDNNVLFGIKRIKGESFRIIIPIHDIKEIRLKNEALSDAATIFIVLGCVGLGILVLFYELSESLRDLN